jgi:dTDP-glucose pyrophosphorylase
MFKDYIISNNLTIDKVIKKFEDNFYKTLVVINKSKHYLGVISDGDLRRGILKLKTINAKVDTIINKKTISLTSQPTNKKINQLFQNQDIDLIPIINKKKVSQIIFKNKQTILNNSGLKKITCVIMAGGFGKRLLNFTKFFPKPLMPYKNRSLLESIINKFHNQGIKNFIVTTYFKSSQIRDFLKKLMLPVEIDTTLEKKPLGTIGSIKIIMKKKISDNFFVTNCDTILDINYNNIHKYHLKKKSMLTIVVTKKKIKFPYGQCSINKKKMLIDIKEKPSFDIMVNTGCYLLNKKVIKFIPSNKSTDINDLIKSLKKKKIKINTYEINEGNWSDFGQISSFNI